MRTAKAHPDYIDLEILLLFLRERRKTLVDKEPLWMHNCQVFRTCPAKGILKRYTWLE